MDINKVLNEDKKILETHLQKMMCKIDIKYADKIVESMKYSLMAGGKRIRPCLFIEMLKMYNLDYQKYLDMASTLEMIHTYSLIHDDLPAMDNDDLRRGKPTNHKMFGEDIAILTGDALLNYAYEILFSECIRENGNINIIQASKLIADCSGIYGMIGGQLSDVLNENKEISVENLHYIHENKTGKLLLASILSAAYVANSNEEDIENIEEYAYNIGMAFQISDDILDVIGVSEKLGKTVGKDEQNGKNTYVKYFGIENSKEKLQEHIRIAKESIRRITDKDTEFFVGLSDYIGKREY